jgi:hypothetical protein
VLLANAAAYITMIVCGVNFPMEALPAWLQAMAHFLPMTNGLLAVRAVVEGGAYADVLPLVGAEILLGMVYGAVGYAVFAWQLSQARRDGKVELFSSALTCAAPTPARRRRGGRERQGRRRCPVSRGRWRLGRGAVGRDLQNLSSGGSRPNNRVGSAESGA